MCRCDCGNTVERTGYALSPTRNSTNNGCGCGHPPTLEGDKLAEAIRLYESGKSVWEIGAAIGFRGQLVWRKLKEAGVVMRSNSDSVRVQTVIENAFSAAGEHRDYWAGFMMADGCVQKRSSNGFTISLGLAECDLGHIEKFKAFVCPDAPIEYREISTGNSCSVRFRSKKVADDLAGLGITPRKSLTAKASTEMEMSRHFWRGVVDGDGWLSRPDANFVIGLCGSRCILGQFTAFCGGLLEGHNPTVAPSKTIFRTSIYGRQAQIIIRELYHGCAIALDRKMEMAVASMAYVPPESNRPMFYRRNP